MKKISHMQMNLKMLAIFVAGVAVATLGWWQSNRLNLAFGSEAGINEVRGESNGIVSGKNCSPSDRPVISRKYDGCNMTITMTKCNPNRRYVTYAKTKSGVSTWTFSAPVKGAREEVTYTSMVEDKKLEVRPELDRVKLELDKMKNIKPVKELAKDQEYLTQYTYMKELENASRKCAPNMPTTQQKPVAR